MRWLLPILLCIGAGCDAFTDAATRIAYDIESGASRLGKAPGARHVIDQVGALIIWCYGAGAETVSSHSTSYHRRFVDTPRTWLLDKPAGSTLAITLEWGAGRALIADIR